MSTHTFVTLKSYDPSPTFTSTSFTCLSSFMSSSGSSAPGASNPSPSVPGWSMNASSSEIGGARRYRRVVVCGNYLDKSGIFVSPIATQHVDEIARESAPFAEHQRAKDR